jgi:hypothetical protein
MNEYLRSYLKSKFNSSNVIYCCKYFHTTKQEKVRKRLQKLKKKTKMSGKVFTIPFDGTVKICMESLTYQV